MKMEDIGIGWIDLLIVALLIVGVVRGRKRGMSEELLDLIKWGLIVAVGGLCYQPLGEMLAGGTMFSRLSSYLAAYLGIVLLFILLFSFIRKHIGGKVIESDVFGSMEYYLGMCAGAVRYACMIVVGMALLHARYYSPAEVRAKLKYQEDVYGSNIFPTLCNVQHEVFGVSLSGRLSEDYLPILLIKSTAPEDKSLGSASIIKARERNVYEVLEK